MSVQKKLLSIIVLICCVLACTAAHAVESSDNTVAVTSDASTITTSTEDPIITCGTLMTDTLGMTPESRRYRVYLRQGTTVAFASTGVCVITFSVCTPTGELLGTVNKVSNSSFIRFGTFQMPSSGYYTIIIYGSCGVFKANCLTGQGTSSNTNTRYNRTKAAAYALQYWNGHNTAYPLYGADCTNFVSQCVYDGGMPMIVGGNDSHWYYSSNGRSPSWAGADWFMRHWTKIRLSSYNGRAYRVNIYTRDYILSHWSDFFANVEKGDIIQYLQWGNSSKAYHSAIAVAKKASEQEIEYCSHSSVCNNGSLQSYIEDEIYSDEWIIVIRISSN